MSTEWMRCEGCGRFENYPVMVYPVTGTAVSHLKRTYHVCIDCGMKYLKTRNQAGAQ